MHPTTDAGRMLATLSCHKHCWSKRIYAVLNRFSACVSSGFCMILALLRQWQIRQ